MAKEIDIKRLTRYQIINEQLGKFPGRRVSAPELRKLCRVGQTQLKNDIAFMRDEWQAPIKYDSGEKGYYYTDKDYSAPVSLLSIAPRELTALRLAVDTLNQYQELAVFKDLKGIFAKIAQAVRYKAGHPSEESTWIHFETVPYFRGSELIAFFHEAIREQRELSFAYEKYEDEPVKTYVIHPHWLKEHRNRWYVVGWCPGDRRYRIFGLDRIHAETIRVTKRGFERRQDQTLDILLKNAFGIFINLTHPVERVELSFTKQRMQYFESQPFHKPHAGPVQVGDRYHYIFYLIINDELIMELARMGDSVKVLNPATLANEVRDYHLRAAGQYG
ncbi:MAG: WYL domain-containing protein [Bacteroidia bacterium]|nr:WYL domain-containing protein [Bacteroidia bacterium]